GNNFKGAVAILQATNASLSDADDFDLGPINLAGDLTLDVGGALTQSGLVTVAGQTTLTADSIDLNDFANHFNTLQFTTPGAASFNDANDLVLGGGASSAASLTITTDGALLQTSQVAVAGQTTLNAASITLDDAANDFNQLQFT